jgi:hypothetical protein
MKHLALLQSVLTYIFYQLKVHFVIKILMGLVVIFIFYMLCYYTPETIEFVCSEEM